VEKVLSPTLEAGRVVVMDNRLMRKAGARTREALVEAMGVAILAISARDARGFFEHCGYSMPVQSL
jgi:hypothetical protein